MIKFIITFIALILFIGCNNNNISKEEGIVSEYSLTTKEITSTNENHTVMLNLENGLETGTLENDLHVKGSDCYSLTPKINLDNISIQINNNMPITHISILDKTTNHLVHFYKDSSENFSFTKNNEYQICVQHNGTDDTQTVFMQFNKSLDSSCETSKTSDNVIDSLNAGACRGCTITNDEILHLDTKNLRNTDLTCAILKGVNFRNFHLENAIFDKVTFTRVEDDSNFPDITYINTSFASAHLEGASFKSVDFKETPSVDVLFQNADLENVDFSSSIFNFSKGTCLTPSITFNKNSFKFANMENLCFQTTEGKEVNLNDIDFEETILTNAELSDIDFTGSNFSKSTIYGVDFYNANLSNTKFNDTNFSNVDLSHANFSNANLNNAKFEGVIVKNTNFHSANFSGVSTKELSKVAKKGLVDLTHAKQSIIAWGYSGRPAIEWTDCTNWREGTDTNWHSFDAKYWDDNYLCTTDLGTWWFYDNGDHGKNPHVRLHENSDRSWDDNYLIYDKDKYDINLYFKSDGIMSEKFCVNIKEPSDESNTWGDNYLCFDFN